MLDLAVVLQELNGRAKKFGLVSVHGTSREGDIRSCFCAVFSEFREEEDLDRGKRFPTWQRPSSGKRESVHQRHPEELQR